MIDPLGTVIRTELASRDWPILIVNAARNGAVKAVREMPGYEIRTTEGQRKAWDGDPDLTVAGWWPLDWERYDFHEEIVWVRERPEDAPPRFTAAYSLFHSSWQVTDSASPVRGVPVATFYNEHDATTYANWRNQNP